MVVMCVRDGGVDRLTVVGRRWSSRRFARLSTGCRGRGVSLVRVRREDSRGVLLMCIASRLVACA